MQPAKLQIDILNLNATFWHCKKFPITFEQGCTIHNNDIDSKYGVVWNTVTVALSQLYGTKYEIKKQLHHYECMLWGGGRCIVKLGFKVKFLNNSISGIVGLMDMKQNGTR